MATAEKPPLRNNDYYVVSNAFDWKKIGGFPRLVMPVFAPAASCRFTLEISPGMIAALKGPFLAVQQRPR
jgi:hypothetical protein